MASLLGKFGENKCDAKDQLLFFPPFDSSERMGFLLCSPSDDSHEKRSSTAQARSERLPYSGVQYQGSPFSR